MAYTNLSLSLHTTDSQEWYNAPHSRLTLAACDTYCAVNVGWRWQALSWYYDQNCLIGFWAPDFIFTIPFKTSIPHWLFATKGSLSIAYQITRGESQLIEEDITYVTFSFTMMPFSHNLGWWIENGPLWNFLVDLFFVPWYIKGDEA